MKANLNKVLLDIALNLSSNQNSETQYQHLIDGIDQVFPCDASALFILDQNGFLTPVAVKGISSSILARRFFPKTHPRLQAIMESKQPVRFGADCELPDPFSGILLSEEAELDVHDCMGCSLYVGGQLVGVLTLDSLTVGAFDSIDPVTIETFAALAAATLRNIAQVKALKAQNKKQKHVTETLIQQARSKQGEMVGVSPQIEKLRTNIATVAQSDYAVLITGETGVGKELVAHSVHAQSHRANKPMIYVNCAALPEGLAESELFGHVKGAFTGANSSRAGKFELADGGTIFLDELGELPLVLQAKLLRVIQQGELQRVGSDQHLLVNVRIIAATNRSLIQEVESGQFRADLYHRLNVFPISVPPLRKREGDLPILAGYLLEKVRSQFNIPNLHLHPKSLSLLERQAWPGNVRELEHTLTRAALRAIQNQQQIITTQHFDGGIETAAKLTNNNYLPKQSQAMRGLVEDYQKDLILHALEKSNGTWAKAAEFLQMDRGNLYRMGKKLGVEV
ncbi:nitric oxide reductase transcriptional regulator NorR [Vibrio europaeus]|uniref:Nitric oxide reductase transcriptional regulator NorR n=1 Tax=Vibrio europaeus TaxID=300876 RepID=A0AAE7B0T1_9VIBR|nr:nitric oxide reductase transcriptional regulator NorR [Vibrio europaeus]MDC5805783.1 nitric oxide reductase transcriptional regulator NorR [Vibrio europaeus]MDC5812080.1 nitric oxide reductase transcriptional regulator NorR [Vibrio europaeus]MDC5826143.1 nitric oxide reductase transcriptional regulator NorR [Vibrio europaeus]MDC5831508.1 nitric oxide reductase transcriptional regulator NorR [Vibrio europaeus]MDC5834463.1 nitric oxide reductase transcriptional regulator NorR [Vibrio europaeu